MKCEPIFEAYRDLVSPAAVEACEIPRRDASLLRILRILRALRCCNQMTI